MCVLSFIDDCIVIGRTFDEHLLNLQLVLNRFRFARLKLKPKKCRLFQSEVSFLVTLCPEIRYVLILKEWLVSSRGHFQETSQKSDHLSLFVLTIAIFAQISRGSLNLLMRCCGKMCQWYQRQKD